MLSATTGLGRSHHTLMHHLHAAPDLRDPAQAEVILRLLAQRRTMDLTDLQPGDQAALLAARAVELLPGRDHLTQALTTAGKEQRPLTVKFGIDPTAADVHIGHAVPMLLASRFQRMGHQVVFIVGDVTARIGDPSGRVADRPTLTEEAIAANMASYRAQVSPLFDFERAQFRHNSQWLDGWRLPDLLALLGRLPVSMALQRDDFRSRLADGSGLSMAELVYSVVMALDSVEIGADVEIGGLDQLLNMHMCRKVMEVSGQPAELVIATGLIEGTDGTGVKMSKSKGNYIGLSFAPSEVFGGVMSAADRLMPAYLRALTELLDPEVELLLQLAADGRAHPMGIKTLLAGDITAALHGLDVAARCRDEFAARFSRRWFSDLPDLPTVSMAEHHGATIAQLLASILRLIPSLKQVRRVASDGGLRLITETVDSQHITVLRDADITFEDLSSRHAETLAGTQTKVFLKCGRTIVDLRP